jgi:hypothetical protein
MRRAAFSRLHPDVDARSLTRRAVLRRAQGLWRARDKHDATMQCMILLPL